MLESAHSQKDTRLGSGMHIGWFQLFVAIAVIGASGAASALGFGPIRSTVVLGQTLNIAVPVNLAEGETLTNECVSAEVVAGDSKLQAGTVRVRVTQGRDATEGVLRITTTSVVEEPVLTVTVSAGCPARLSRTLVLLADPPLVSTATAAAQAPTLPSVAPPPAASATPQAARAAPGALVAPGRATRPAAPPRATRAAVRTPPARAVVANAASAPSAVATPPEGRGQGSSAPAPLQKAGAKAEPKPRLQLDGGQVSLSQAAVSAAREQAAAAEAAASAAGERVQAMEAELARLRADAKAQTDALVQLRQQLALDRAQRDQPSSWLMALMGVAALLVGVAAWLGWRLRQQAKVQRTEGDWWERGAAGSAAAASQAADFQPSRIAVAPRMASAPAPWSDSMESRSHEVDVLLSPQTVPAPTSVTIPSLPPAVPTPAQEEASRAMSVDEQIDLEQQADFFIALGHDDAAIDLLMAHMRSTGGGSPLPFLKLLEIHRRRDQREAYERTRVRFNQRFNSVAPEWDADPKLGRTLVDYPLAMGRVQRAWPSPLDAMAEIEALLFRRGDEAELFDLPAYQEVLFLYQMARDLHQTEDAGTADVDVLLPIGGRSAPLAVAEGTIVLRPEFNDGEPLSLDLDLTTDHGDGAAVATPVLIPAPTSAPDLTLDQIDNPSPPEPEDFWGSNPDARPTR